MGVCYKNGVKIPRQDLFEQLHDADIILVGEYHNNVPGHKIELEMTKEVLKHTPSTGVAMEMFERQCQPLVDLFLQDKISKEALEKSTFVSNWGGGQNTWQEWYQPIVNQVKYFYAQGARLIAANAARSYVKIANIEGYEPLAELKAHGNPLFEIPDPNVDVSRYIDRLNNLDPIRDLGGAESTQTGDAKLKPRSPSSRSQGFINAQQIWDATMSHSVFMACQRHPKVMLFIGDFHVKQQGGTTQRVKKFLPEAKVVNVSILPVDNPYIWQEEHRGHADFVIYTESTSGFKK